ncbi:MAG: AgmX/PglI C-terminal domain-containing protein [Bradymonadaceae bacterium]|nr:AgmX/PglI C-terminal domain-containing protein [Lujinxingiaceae bacterium]
MKSNSHNLRVALVWNGTIYQEKSFAQTSEPIVTIGDEDSNIFTVPAPGVPAVFPMFERTPEGYTLRFTDKLDGSVHLGEEEFDLEELIEDKKATKRDAVTTESGQAASYELALRSGDWGVISLGKINIFFQLLEKGDKVAGRGFTGSFEGAMVLCLLFAMVTHVGFLLTAMLAFDPNPDLDDMVNYDRFVKFMVDDVLDPLEEEEVDTPEEDTTGKKAGGEEGKFGDPDEDIPESKIPKVDGEMVDKIDVKNIGINKALSSELLSAGPFKNIFVDSDGFDAKMNVAMSGEGGDLVVGRGAGGMGMRGTGGGGGGEGFGRVGGLGKVDTGGGKGTGAKIGKGTAKKVTPKLSQGTPQVGDFCDAANIRRVVGQRANAIRYCFEKELQTNPSLSGQIVAQWRIQLDGAVASPSIASSTMNNREVEGCITRVIQRMRFEKPDGGICIINYPFVFSGLE